MVNPILLRAHRGPLVESTHRGALAIRRERRTLFALGDVASPVFLRSSAKPFQAMEFLLSGAADAFGVPDGELAVACASHGAEEVHTRAVLSMLARGGLDPSALRCGAHPPACTQAAVALARSGEKPTVLHNNCSGKHAAMVLTARHLRLPVDSYLDPEHPVQVANRRNLALFAGVPAESILLGTDGCSAPNFAVSLEAQADAFARLATPDGNLPPAAAAAARRIASAMMAHPRMVAWEGAGDAALMAAAPGRVLSKLGAEGIQCLGLPGTGAGIALKADDGGPRLRIPLTVAVLLGTGVFTGEEAAAVGRDADLVLRNHRGLDVGSLEVALPGDLPGLGPPRRE